MNHVAEEMLMHYGMPRRSGRYPWGSGEDPYQSARDFLGRVEELRKSGFTYTDEKTGKRYSGDLAIAKSLGLTSTQFRTEIGLANNERDMYELSRIKALREKGLGYTAIGRELGMSESTVRSKLNEQAEARLKSAQATADILEARLKEFEAEGGMIDVGVGVERELGISKEKLNQALYLLERKGYGVYNGRFEQKTNPGQFTTQKVLCPPDIKPKGDAKSPQDIYDLDRVHSVKDYISRDGGATYEKKFHYPESMDSKRLMIRYNEEGGLDMDGVVELRRGVPDLSLGESRYSQVRILVDGTHYIKGMAIYSDDLPPGIDVRFNTNKHQGTPKMDVLKKIKDDPDNPFGSAIKDVDQGGQYWYTDKDGNRKLGLINKRADEGDWSDWADALPSQFLGKQSRSMALKQLNLAKTDRQAEFDEICALTNPTIKKHLLAKFADSCDSAAVHLKAAALPGQKYHVIVPVNSLKETEVFAPGYKPGTKLALIRYPHGGTFEIPILTVTHKNPIAQKIIGLDSMDAVCINSKVAARLSGADFDGDTVMCIPTHDRGGKVKIASKKGLEGLEGFDPKEEYGPETYKGKDIRLMTKRGTQTQMGIISNLITDMTLAGANDDELAAAVRHSMVVIDAEKHKLNYKQSEIDNNIAALHKRYQGKETGGAATILSKAKGQKTVDKRQGTPHINTKYNKKGELNEWYDPSKPEGSLIYKTADDLYYPDRKYDKATKTVTIRTADGKKISYSMDDKDAVEKYTPVKRVNPDTGEVSYTNKSGDISYKLQKRKQKTTKMADTDNAYTLVSDMRHPMEIVYADYANSMKALANQARMEMVATGKINYSSSAKAAYQEEVKSLMTKLNTALLNTTRERTANRMATAEINAKKKAGLITDKADEKKAAQRALSKYRTEVGSVKRKDRNIDITDREWEAIQAGAISESKLKQILDNTDVDKLRERAMPRTTGGLTASQMSRIRAYQNSNYSLSEIADKLGVSTTTVSKYLKGVK